MSFSQPSTTRPILGTDRRTGEFVALVPSATVEGKYWIVTRTGCQCPGFGYRNTCRHFQATPRQPVTIPDAVAAKAAEYRAIFAEDERPAPRLRLVSSLQS